MYDASSQLLASSETEELLQNAHRIFGTLYSVASCTRIVENLPIVTTLKGLVAKEMDFLVFNAIGFLGVVLEMLEAVCFVPAVGEYVERDLATD